MDDKEIKIFWREINRRIDSLRARNAVLINLGHRREYVNNCNELKGMSFVVQTIRRMLSL